VIHSWVLFAAPLGAVYLALALVVVLVLARD
jgi:hypothetical protein